jgi:hypothetical protein
LALCSQARLRYKWILKHGRIGPWYEEPSKAHLDSIKSNDGDRWAPDGLLELNDARPVHLGIPRVWASAAMTTPTDDVVSECVAAHAIDDRYAAICYQCTTEKSKILESTSLVYCLVLSTCQASDPFINGAHFNGRQIYQLVKCGSREAAVAEAYYAAGVNGWNVDFTCVCSCTAVAEDYSAAEMNSWNIGASCIVEKVRKMRRLPEKKKDQTVRRLFY